MADVTPSQPARPIVFTVISQDGKGADIFVVNDDGTGMRALTHDGYNAEPAWSPNGTKVAFARAKHTPPRRIDLYVMDADGNGMRRLVRNWFASSSTPAWSPDGTMIAFTRNHNIYVIDAEGGRGKRMLTYDGASAMPDWSPDGTQIVYSNVAGHEDEIYVMDANGTNARPLTEPEYLLPKWSPDGTTIAFVGGPLDPDVPADLDQTPGSQGGPPKNRGGPWVYLMNADGSAIRKITEKTAASAAWSADGREIAVSMTGDDEDHADIYILDPSGTIKRQVTKDGTAKGFLDWG